MYLPGRSALRVRMLMLDVRNAISKILDRYSLEVIVNITLRKLRRDKVATPFASRSLPLAAILQETLVRPGSPNPKQVLTEKKHHAAA